MKAARITTVMSLIFLCYCTHSTAPTAKDFARIALPNNRNGALEIKTEREDYSWRAEDLGSSRLIRATLVNLSSQTYYANLGDAMLGSIDQEDLHVVQGSNGHLEQWQAADSWRELPAGIIIEGVRFVALRPQQSHRLLTHLYSLQGDETGAFRIRIEYFDRIDPPEGETVKVDYSNVFMIAR